VSLEGAEVGTFFLSVISSSSLPFLDPTTACRLEGWDKKDDYDEDGRSFDFHQILFTTSTCAFWIEVAGSIGAHVL
jgi:hypothetical protein